MLFPELFYFGFFFFPFDFRHFFFREIDVLVVDLFAATVTSDPVRVLIESNGERKDRDKEDRQFDEQASDVLEAKEWFVEEGEGACDPVRC